MVAQKLYNYKVIVEVYNAQGAYIGESVINTVAPHCSVAAKKVESTTDAGTIYAVDVFRVSAVKP